VLPSLDPATPARARKRSRVLRALIGAWLAVHGFVIAAAPIADSMAVHAESVVAHWEDAQDTSCPPQHDASACQLCQVVSATFAEGIWDRVASVGLVRVAEPVPGDVGLEASSAQRGAPRSRGPPAV